MTMIDRDVLSGDGAQPPWQPRRLLFRYYKDRYAAMLLEDLLQPRLLIRVLREGRFARLLERPAIKALVATKGDGWLSDQDLQLLWPLAVEAFVVTFTSWGSERNVDRLWNQTSRARRQLVLQLNFPHGHDEQYRRLIFNAAEHPFVCRHHPVNKGGRNTLAWARIDVDLLSGEALIEEVQNDWIRKAERALVLASRGYGKFRKPQARDRLTLYTETVLAPYAAIWSEAVLAAALHVLGHVLGVRRVWYHHFETGCALKNLTRKKWRKPPRSLYTDLPKRFCFELTDEPPAFILPAQPRWLRKKLERREGRFWRMDAPHSLTFI